MGKDATLKVHEPGSTCDDHGQDDVCWSLKHLGYAIETEVLLKVVAIDDCGANRADELADDDVEDFHAVGLSYLEKPLAVLESSQIYGLNRYLSLPYCRLNSEPTS